MLDRRSPLPVDSASQTAAITNDIQNMSLYGSAILCCAQNICEKNVKHYFEVMVVTR
jgi:hypothetical protein